MASQCSQSSVQNPPPGCQCCMRSTCFSGPPPSALPLSTHTRHLSPTDLPPVPSHLGTLPILYLLSGMPSPYPFGQPSHPCSSMTAQTLSYSLVSITKYFLLGIIVIYAIICLMTIFINDYGFILGTR